MFKYAKAILLSIATLCVIQNKASADDAIDACIVRHSATIDAIVNLHCKFTIDREAVGNNAHIVGEYWRNKQSERIKWESAGVLCDCYIYADRIISMAHQTDKRDGKLKHSATILPNTGSVSVGISPWRDALIGVDSQRGLGAANLKEFLSHFKDLSNKTDEAKNIISSNDGLLIVVIRSDRNHLISELSITHDLKFRNGESARVKISESVDTFQQTGKDQWFPAKVTRIKTANQEVKMREVISFKEIAINRSLDKNVFEPKYTGPTDIYDKIQGTQYRVDSAGVLLTTPEPLETATVGTSSDASQEKHATLTEPRLWGWRIAPVSFTVLAIVGAYWLIRYVRQRKLS